MAISNSKYGVIISAPGLGIVLILVIIPTVALFVTSVLHFTGIDPITFIGLGNFREIFSDRLFWLSLEKTAIYAAGATILTLSGGMILALLLSKITIGSGVFRALAMLPWAVPLVISGFIWRWIVNPHVGILSHALMTLGLIDTPLIVLADPNLAMIAVIVADSWVRIPFMSVFLLAGMQSVPREFYDAAEIDGADCIDSFRYITLPLIKRVALVGVLIVSMITFRTIDVIQAMTGGGPGRATYVTALYLIDQLWIRVNFGTGAATGVMLLLLISGFVGFFVYQMAKKE